jgi:hypothetical protein
MVFFQDLQTSKRNSSQIHRFDASQLYTRYNFSSAILNKSGERASPCCKPIITRNSSDNTCSSLTWYFVPFTHIFIRKMSLLGIQKSYIFYEVFPGKCSHRPSRNQQISATQFVFKYVSIIICTITDSWSMVNFFFFLKSALVPPYEFIYKVL